MYLSLSDGQLRQISRTHIESLEKWARVMLHHALTGKFGPDYIHAKNPDDNYTFKKALVEKADSMMAAEPGRFPTHLDTFYLDELIYLLTRSDVYSLLQPAIGNFYPEGINELRTFLTRLVSIRNKLSHTNPFSLREAEQAVCYSNDFTDAAKQYFVQKNMDKEFNTPNILRITDSLGNEYPPKEVIQAIHVTLKDPVTGQPKVFFRNDTFSVSLTMDPSFQPSDYEIKWHAKKGVEVLDNGTKINVVIGDELIGESTILSCNVISNNPWHRFRDHDQQLIIAFKALPTPN